MLTTSNRRPGRPSRRNFEAATRAAIKLREDALSLSDLPLLCELESVRQLAATKEFSGKFCADGKAVTSSAPTNPAVCRSGN